MHFLENKTIEISYPSFMMNRVGGPNQPDCLEVAIGVIPDTVSGMSRRFRSGID
jgi:hypothetical protein